MTKEELKLLEELADLTRRGFRTTRTLSEDEKEQNRKTLEKISAAGGLFPYLYAQEQEYNKNKFEL
jgi:hypothetical protein